MRNDTKEEIKRMFGENTEIKGSKISLDLSDICERYGISELSPTIALEGILGDVPAVERVIFNYKLMAEENKKYYDHYCLEYERIHGEKHYRT